MRARERKELETRGGAFLASIEGPSAPRRLREYGAQRIWSQAQSLKESGAGAEVRRLVRNPALLRHALVACIILLLVLTLSTTGAYALSSGAQPDSALYGLKIFFERARLALTFSGLEEARVEMEYSLRRMEEIENLASRGTGKGADRWLAEYARNLEGAGSYLESVFNEEASALSLGFQEMLDAQAKRLESLRDLEPSQLVESLDAAYHACNRQRERMRRRCGTDGGEKDGGKGQPDDGGKSGNGQGGPGCSSESEGSVPSGSGDATCSQQTGTESAAAATGNNDDEIGGQAQPQDGERLYEGPYGGKTGGSSATPGTEGEGSPGGYMPRRGCHMP
ncbi:MAG: hypothetical protein H5T74_11830 [Actinobacteria bacterium]|nr:hypothetical protein [Actinomycetota bacterium]